MNTDHGVDLPFADEAFFEVFMPYELRLAQRRAMTWGPQPEDMLPPAFVGLYLIRAAVTENRPFPSDEDGGAEIRDHLVSLTRAGLRDSDVLGSAGDNELLAVVRDLDPHQSYVVAQRLLSACTRSELLSAVGINVRVGYLVYPLTSQPNFPPGEWRTLVRLARTAGEKGTQTSNATGFGLLRGPAVATNNIPETDLVDLAFQDLDSLINSGLLSLQRIHLMAGI